MKASTELLTGKTEEHVVELPESSKKIHADVLPFWELLVSEAQKEGFRPQIVSGFRGFAAQLGIWNAKARGERPLLDSNANPLDLTKLSEREIIFAILRWSALPGASRHHWGTDIDVIDAAGLTPGMKVELVPDEFSVSGPFGKFHLWLDENMSDFGFYRPYAEDLGGVSPERWHLSFAPLAEDYLKKLDASVLWKAIEGESIVFKDTLRLMLPDIFKRFVTNVQTFDA